MGIAWRPARTTAERARSATLGANVAIQVTPLLDIAFDVAYAGAARRSEFRRWVDQNNRPIEQTTFFRRVPVTLSVKRYLTPRGRSIGRFAWVPARRATYVGIGAGMMWYAFRQVGDFVDFQTLKVFPDAFQSSAWTPVVHALAGVDVALGRKSVQLKQTQARERADAIVREARERAHQIIDQAQHRANDLVDQAKGAASTEGQRLVAAAHQQIELEATRARESLRREVAQIAVIAAAKLLGREIDARAHADLISKFATEI